MRFFANYFSPGALASVFLGTVARSGSRNATWRRRKKVSRQRRGTIVQSLAFTLEKHHHTDWIEFEPFKIYLGVISRRHYSGVFGGMSLTVCNT